MEWYRLQIVLNDLITVLERLDRDHFPVSLPADEFQRQEPFFLIRFRNELAVTDSAAYDPVLSMDIRKYHIVLPAPDDSLTLMDARLMVRDRIQAKDIEALKDDYGKQFDYIRFQRASENADQKLGEDPDAIRARGRELSMQQRQHRYTDKASVSQEKNHHLER